MLLDVSLNLLKDWYKNAWMLGGILLLMGLAVLLGSHYEAATVLPNSLFGWIMGFLALTVFSLYFLLHVKWVGDVMGHPSTDEPLDLAVKYVKVLVFFLVMDALSLWLASKGLGILALLLWILLLLFPVAVVLDDVSPWDDAVSSLEAWARSPGTLLELLVVFPVLLLTAFFLEVNLGMLGYLVSVLLTLFFTLPLLTTMLALSYLLRYPITRRAIRS